MKRILKIGFVIWVILWPMFILRELFVKGYFYDYKALISRPLEGKRAYVTGEDFYSFLMFCRRTLRPDAKFTWIGVKKDSIDKRRGEYYLYPRLEEPDNAEFVLVYNEPHAVRNGYAVFAEKDSNSYILKKER